MSCQKINTKFRTFFSPCFAERGIAHFFLIAFLIAVLVLGVYLVQQRTNLLPKASESISSPVSGPVEVGDNDKDGFNNLQEAFMGTDSDSACGVNAWPVDVNNDTYVNGADVSTLVPYIQGAKAYDKRYDLNQDYKIDTSDVTVIQSNFLKTCAVIEKTAFFRMWPKPIAKLGEEVEINLAITTPSDAINLASAQIDYPADKLEVVNVTVDKNIFNNTIENYTSNGRISIIVGSTSPVKTVDVNSGILIAKILFKTKNYGIAEISINKQESELLRAEDGENIFSVEKSISTAISVNPSTSSPSPSPTSTSLPTSSPTSTSEPESTPDPNTAACVITKADWVTTGLVQSNTTAEIRIEATGGCANKKVVFDLWEDDGLLGRDSVIVKPQEIYFSKANSQNLFVGTTTWITEFQEDGIFGSSYPPEYVFSAVIKGQNNAINSSNQLTVAREVGVPSPVEGDINGDGKSNLRDLSYLLSNWEKEVPEDNLDIHEDGKINTADYSALLAILKQNGVLRQ